MARFSWACAGTGIFVGVIVGVLVGVLVGRIVGVLVGVLVAVGVIVAVAVLVAVAVGGVASGCGFFPPLIAGVWMESDVSSGRCHGGDRQFIVGRWVQPGNGVRICGWR